MGKFRLFLKKVDVFFHICYKSLMNLARKERVGKPDLFTGWKEEPAYFLIPVSPPPLLPRPYYIL